MTFDDRNNNNVYNDSNNNDWVVSIYGHMSTEQRIQEVNNNKPLIGYWKYPSSSAATTTTTSRSMPETTTVLQKYFGNAATAIPTGSEFLETIGSLTNSTHPPFHWTEVVGVAATQNRKLGDKTEHAWHQDYGQLETDHSHNNLTSQNNNNNNNKHVFFAFPFENDYYGTGVFPHLVKLKYEQWVREAKADGIKTHKSFFYETACIPEEYIVRPRYIPGKQEIIVFRDIDVLHSSPDIQYRTSIMRLG
jgi:hypothetical protein